MYDTPTPITHVLNSADAIDFGSGSPVALTLEGPADAEGLVRAILIEVTEVVAADTTEPVLEVGVTAGEAEIAATTIPDGTAVGTFITAADDDYEDRRVDAGETIHITANTGVDGTAVTGQAKVTLVIDWDIEQPRPFRSG